MAEISTMVRYYDPHAEAGAAIKKLQESGFDMNKLSIVGKDYYSEKHMTGFHNSRGCMKDWEQLGAFWGGLLGLLFGSAFFLIPGVGRVIVFGPLVSWIIRAPEGVATAGEPSPLGAGLYCIGVPKYSILEYERALKFDKFLVIARGTFDEIARARRILDTPGRAQIAPTLRGEIRLRV